MNNVDSGNFFPRQNSPPDKKRLLKHSFPARQFKKSLLLIVILSALFVPLLLSCPDAGSSTIEVPIRARRLING